MIIARAWRSWRHARGVAVLAIVAFAVGIGSATAIFTVINAVMLRPLPYPDGERLLALYGANLNEPGRYSSISLADVVEYQQRTTSFDAFGWFRFGNFNLTSPGEPQYLAGVELTRPLARVLGPPMLGQWFADESSAVISHTLWRRLGSDPNIVGTAITLDDRPYTVTGVMGAGFGFPIGAGIPFALEAEIWIPLDESGGQQNAGIAAYFAWGRRKPGVTHAQAQADVKRVAAEIARLEPDTHPSYTAEVVGLRESPFSNLHSMLLLLFAAAGLLLLIACSNVATLLLARSVAMARETATRIALGVGRWHLASRYLADAALVALAGAAAGVALSLLLVRVIVAVGSEYLPNPDEIAIDWTVVAFGLALAALVAVLTGIAPLWHALRTPPSAVLADGVRASAAAPIRRLSQALVVAEIALAFALLAVSAILVVHLRNLTRVPTGFNPEDLLTFELTAPARVVSSNTLAAYQKRLIEGLEAIPGVTSAGIANQLPLDGCCFSGTVYPEGRPPTEEGRRVSFVLASPGFLTTMAIPLRAGRSLTEADTSEEMLFAVVNEAAVRRYWPDRNPIGAFGRLSRPNGDRFQIVGVVGDVRNDGLSKPPEAELYLLSSIIPVNQMVVLVRAPIPAERLIPDVRRAVRSVDATLAVQNPRTMTAVVDDSMQLERISSLLMTFFAVAALVMAALGIYGVVSYSVRQRTVELGTRMALGATSRDIFSLVIGSGLKMATAGVIVGAAALVGAVWLLMRFLEVRDIGWVPLLASLVVVGLIAVGSSYAPAWRASFLSPMAAIRDEPSSAWGSIRGRFLHVVRDARGALVLGRAAPLPPTALTDFVAAARSADSFDDALRLALRTVCERLGVESAALLHGSEGERPVGATAGVSVYRRRAAVGRYESFDWHVPANGFLESRLRAYPLPLPFGPGELDALVEWAAAHRTGRLEELQELARADVRLAVPLHTRSEMTGMLLLGPRAQNAAFGPGEKQLLASCGDQFALMIENARLTDRVVRQDALRRDMELAAEVQRRLLPDEPPSASAVQFAAISVPARTIGGDYYDFIDVGNERIGIALADVSGKGVAAALIMSVVQASLRIIASEGDISLPRLAARMNEFLYRTTPGNKYATFFYAQVDSDRRQLRYVNAGHNPPYLVRAQPVPVAGDESTMIELTAGGAVVGMLPGLSYEEAVVDLCPSDVLLAYTDGVTEAHNPEHLEFGEERLKALLREVAHLPADGIRERIASELRNWIQDSEQFDDLTFVVMKVV